MKFTFCLFLVFAFLLVAQSATENQDAEKTNDFLKKGNTRSRDTLEWGVGKLLEKLLPSIESNSEKFRGLFSPAN